MLIEDAAEDDLPAILAITNDAILRTTALWHVDAQTIDECRRWWRTRREAGFPVFVARGGAGIDAYATYGPFRPFAGFAPTVEHSVYVDRGARGRGLGRALLDHLVADAGRRGLHAMVGAIEAGNDASLALHAKAGFREVGRLPEVGCKFGRRLDLVLVQKFLHQGPLDD